MAKDSGAMSSFSSASSSGSDVTCIVSCLHEEDTIGECLDRLVGTLPGAEVLVLCGGQDHTYDIARERARSHNEIRVLQNYGDSGKGHAIKLGITLASRNLMAQVDADLQFLPEEIPRLLAPLRSGEAEISLGCRFMPGADRSAYDFSLLRVMGNHVVNAYVSLLAGRRVYDVTSGAKAWTRAGIERVAFQDNGFRYELEIVLRAARQGVPLAMVPVTYQSRQGGVSGHGVGLRERWSVVKTGLELLWDATAIRTGLPLPGATR